MQSLSPQQKALHLDAIARWFARRRKTSIRKILFDLTIRQPNRHDEELFYTVTGRRTFAFVAGAGEIWQPCKKPTPVQTHEMIGNVFDVD